MAKKTWPRTPEVNEMFVVALDPDEAYSFFVEGSSEVRRYTENPGKRHLLCFC